MRRSCMLAIAYGLLSTKAMAQVASAKKAQSIGGGALAVLLGVRVQWLLVIFVLSMTAQLLTEALYNWKHPMVNDEKPRLAGLLIGKGMRVMVFVLAFLLDWTCYHLAFDPDVQLMFSERHIWSITALGWLIFEQFYGIIVTVKKSEGDGPIPIAVERFVDRFLHKARHGTPAPGRRRTDKEADEILNGTPQDT